MMVSRFAEMNDKCTFCGHEPQIVIHLFYSCSYTISFCDLERFMTNKSGSNIDITCKDVIVFLKDLISITESLKLINNEKRLSTIQYYDEQN